ncbi:MAG: 16S rRNA (guanine(527)-N(7))-methyltransferase RsmG [Candidatus Nanopelagicales bacterium]
MTNWRTAAEEHYPMALPQLDSYVELLSTLGVERGLIGPREADRLWERHILNCAVVADIAGGFIPEEASVVDVGTGAGLPGIVWAIVRPDLHVVLVESMQRRVDVLTIAVEQLELTNRVDVVRGRAEDLVGEVVGDVVTARAVAPLGRLLGWLAPLSVAGGSLVVLKGQRVADELAEAAPELAAIKAGSVEVHICGEDWLDEPTNVVQIQDFDPTGLVVAGKRGKPRGAGNRGR